jgi:hypothetical protein
MFLARSTPLRAGPFDFAQGKLFGREEWILFSVSRHLSLSAQARLGNVRRFAFGSGRPECVQFHDILYA